MDAFRFVAIGGIAMLIAAWRMSPAAVNEYIEVEVVEKVSMVETINAFEEYRKYDVYEDVLGNSKLSEKPSNGTWHKIPVVELRGEIVPLDSELRCLSVAIHLEARNRSLETREAMGWVMANRIGKYGNKNFCDVVTNAKTQNGFVELYQCHFSFWCEGNEVLRVAHNPIEDREYRRAVQIAYGIITNLDRKEYLDPTKGATHYHRSDVSPSWKTQFAYLGSWEDHKFYYGH